MSLSLIPKFPKALVAYQDNPVLVKILSLEGDYRCGNCLLFLKPDRCLIVEGLIKAEAWCILWVGLPKLTLTTLLKK